eukprot:10713349-Alexandrium_andersonii.AAC.1
MRERCFPARRRERPRGAPASCWQCWLMDARRCDLLLFTASLSFCAWASRDVEAAQRPAWL